MPRQRSYTVPLLHQYGLQLDGIAGSTDLGNSDNADIFGAGFHAFWRDPTRGLLGIVGSYVNVENGGSANLFQGGVEAAVYRGKFSVDALAGFAGGDVFETDFFARTMLSHYPTDNISLQLGYGYQNENSSLLYGGEFAFNAQNNSAQSLFVSGEMREEGVHLVAAGLRVYFGKSGKSLIRRHREDDPPQLFRQTELSTFECLTHLPRFIRTDARVTRICDNTG